MKRPKTQIEVTRKRVNVNAGFPETSRILREAWKGSRYVSQDESVIAPLADWLSSGGNY